MIVGQKSPFKLKEIWAIRVRLQLQHRIRELAMFDLGLDSNLSSFPTTERQWLAMAPTNERLDRLDRLVLEARRSAAAREQSYRAQALKLFPWVCGRCARTFDHANLQLLEVHHKNNNHHDNPPDGSNWELLCTYCHENEHSRVKDSAGRSDGSNVTTTTAFNPFADLKAMLASKK